MNLEKTVAASIGAGVGATAFNIALATYFPPLGLGMYALSTLVGGVAGGAATGAIYNAVE